MPVIITLIHSSLPEPGGGGPRPLPCTCGLSRIGSHARRHAARLARARARVRVRVGEREGLVEGVLLGLGAGDELSCLGQGPDAEPLHACLYACRISTLDPAP